MNDASIEKHFIEGLDKPGVVAVNTGDAKKALDEAAKKVDATYFVPFVTPRHDGTDELHGLCCKRTVAIYGFRPKRRPLPDDRCKNLRAS